MSLRSVLIGATFAALSSTVAVAAPVVANGQMSYGELGGVVDPSQLDWKLDRITFDVTAGTTVNFDSRVQEDATHDFNADGRITGVDFFTRLIRASDNVEVAFNDDGGVGADGSISGFDGVFNYTFTTGGTHFFVVGSLGYSVAQAIAGYRAETISTPVASFSDLQYRSDWQVTLTPTGGSISNVVVDTFVVPEPATLGLIALGSLALRRRRPQA